jgi:hypothetical protein
MYWILGPIPLLLILIGTVALLRKLFKREKLPARLMSPPTLFFGSLFASFFVLTFIWNIYGTSLLQRNEFLTSWDTFMWVQPAAAGLVSCLLLLEKNRGSRAIAFRIWIILGLLIAVPLVIWNHRHQSVDFAWFNLSQEPQLHFGGMPVQILDSIDVGRPESESSHNYQNAAADPGELWPYPPGGPFTTNYRRGGHVSDAGHLLPVASVTPSMVGLIEDGRHTRGTESFELSVAEPVECRLVVRSHSRGGEQPITVSINGQRVFHGPLLGQEETDSLRYRKMAYTRPVFVNWPVLTEWFAWFERSIPIPAERLRPGRNRFDVTATGAHGLFSFHYFLLANAAPPQLTDAQPAAPCPLGFDALAARLEEQNWIFRNRANLGNGFEEAYFVNNAALYGGSFLRVVHASGGVLKIDIAAIPYPWLLDLAMSGLAAILFENNQAAGTAFIMLADEMILGRQPSPAGFRGTIVGLDSIEYGGKRYPSVQILFGNTAASALNRNSPTR